MKLSNYMGLAKSLGVSGLALFQAGVKPTHTIDQARGILEQMGVLPTEATSVPAPKSTTASGSTSSPERLAAARAALKKAGMI